MEDKKKATKPKEIVKKVSPLEMKLDKIELALIKVTNILEGHEKLINRIKGRMGL